MLPVPVREGWHALGILPAAFDEQAGASGLRWWQQRQCVDRASGRDCRLHQEHGGDLCGAACRPVVSRAERSLRLDGAVRWEVRVPCHVHEPRAGGGDGKADQVREQEADSARDVPVWHRSCDRVPGQGFQLYFGRQRSTPHADAELCPQGGAGGVCRCVKQGAKLDATLLRHAVWQ